MPKNLSVIDVSPRGRAVLDIKPSNFIVEDFKKPRTLRFGEGDDVITRLYAGMSIGPGFFMYITYPVDILTYP